MIVTPRAAAQALSLVGWEFETPRPPEKKYVLICWPHTSNWDGLLLVMLARSVDLQLEWMVKRSWVESPLAPVMRRIGAVPIDRSRSTHVVEQMVREFEKRDELALAVPPGGTRARVDYWKTGFHRIALGAKVPVVPGYLDFARKRGGLGPAMPMTGDVRVDMDRIRAYYAQRNPIGRHPERVGPIRLRDEDRK